MPSVMHIAVASTLLALSAAAPTVQKRSAFTIRQTANPDHVKNGAAAYAKALAKFGAAPEKISAVLNNNPGSVTVTPLQYDTEYLCPVTIGDQTFTLILDTASSDLWVFGAEVATPSNPPSSRSTHAVYYPGSTAEILQGATWRVRYGDKSSAGGIVYKDTVSIAGITVAGQAVEVATFTNDNFISDGLVGLGFSIHNTVRPTKQRTWFDNAIAQGLPALFGVDLIAGAPGYYDFGGLSSFYSDSDITYVHVDHSRHEWEFTPDSVTIGSGRSFSVGATLLDTGTTLLLLEEAVVLAYYAEVSGAHYETSVESWVFFCNETPPDFTITINGYKAVVPGSYIVYAPAVDSGTYCYGGLQSSAGLGKAIYGDVFIKSQYVVFDRTTDPPRIGFTAKVQRNEETD